VRSASLTGLSLPKRLQALCQAAGEVVDAVVKPLNKDIEEYPLLDVVAGLYSDKTTGV